MDRPSLPPAAAASPAPGIPLFHVRGIHVRLDPSWFLIFLLILGTLGLGYFPGIAPDASAVAIWSASLAAALLFFASILVHELSHALVARAAGIGVPSIRLFLFGGVSEMESEPDTPSLELKVAAAGPLSSFAIALACGALWLFAVPEAWEMTRAIVGYLGWINLALGVFNLLPGLPLDGGRVLRAIVWWRTGSIVRGTRVASTAGKVFATCLMLLGGLEILFGALLGGLWLILIGMFLRRIAAQGYEGLLLKHALSDVPVGRVMVPRERLDDVAPDVSLRELVEDHLLRAGHRGLPVIEDGEPVGLISSHDVAQVPKEEWDERTVRAVMRPVTREDVVAPEDSLFDALHRLGSSGRGRLLVMRGGELCGLISASAIARFVETTAVLRKA